jgi:group I intron endonuclease
MITNTTDGKIYVGKAKDIKSRWRNHRYQLKKGIHTNSHLQSAYDLDGKEAFVYSVLEECDESVAEDREAFYIAKLNSVINGYNMLMPLSSNHGVKVHSEESRRKMSETQRRRGSLSKEHREKIRLNNAFAGKKRPPETIERMRQAQQNRKPLSDDGKLRMAIAARTRGVSRELRERAFESVKAGMSIADALFAIEAGLKTDQFKSTMAMLRGLKAA